MMSVQQSTQPPFADIVRQHGSPIFVYNGACIRRQARILRKALPGMELLYSVKTNPHPPLLSLLAQLGFGADAATAHEVLKARDAGIESKDIYYSAPGKTEEHLALALGKCTIIADSCTELARINSLAQQRGLQLKVGLRINPALSLTAGLTPDLVPGASHKFGVDAESLYAHKELFQSFSALRITGIHIYLRSQLCSHETHLALMTHILELAHFCRQSMQWPLEYVNFGGGFGIESAQNAISLSPLLDMKALGQGVQNLLTPAPFSDSTNDTKTVRLLAESGRFLVAEAGTFLTRIVDIKESRGKKYYITEGTLQAFLRPALQHILQNLPQGTEFPYPLEPLCSGPHSHKISLLDSGAAPLEKVTVSGNLCTALDTVATDIWLPRAEIGQSICISHAGAYGASLSPNLFSSFPPPAEILWE